MFLLNMYTYDLSIYILDAKQLYMYVYIKICCDIYIIYHIIFVQINNIIINNNLHHNYIIIFANIYNLLGDGYMDDSNITFLYIFLNYHKKLILGVSY